MSRTVIRSAERYEHFKWPIVLDADHGASTMCSLRDGASEPALGEALWPMRARSLDGRIRADGNAAGQTVDAVVSASALSRR